jgi:hypothetical protein
MSYHFLQGQEVACWHPGSSDGPPSWAARLTRTAARCCSKDNSTVTSTGSPSGMTSEPSTADHGKGQLTLCLEASPAKTSVRRVKVKDLPAGVLASGSRCSVSLARFGLVMSSRKTVRTSVSADSAPSSKDLSAWGMTFDGECWELGTRVHLTDATECGSSLPTPSANRYGNNRGGKAGRSGPVRHSLESMARHRTWPTPTAGDAKSSGSRNTANSKAHPGVSLTDAVRGDGGTGRLWPTPTAQDAKNTAGISQMKRNTLPLNVEVKARGQAELGRLNPAWVESHLMGWPIGWTDLEQLEMDKFQAWLASHGMY